jgi:hypothetical protein
VQHPTPAARTKAILQVSLATGSTSASTCRPLTRPRQVRLRPGEELHFRGPEVVAAYVAPTGRLGQVEFRPPGTKPFEWKLVNRGSALTVQVRRSTPASPTQICN